MTSLRGGHSVEEAARAAEAIYGVDKNSIETILRDAYERHEKSISGFKESAEKAAKAVKLAEETAERLEKTERRSRKYRRLDGKEDCIRKLRELGAPIDTLAEAFDVSNTQMSNFLRDYNINIKRRKRS